MITLLIDVNLDGHAHLLDSRLRSKEWQQFREQVPFTFVFFSDVGLDRETPDNLVWALCQERGYFLLTANRNRESEDSLEATIRLSGKPNSLPVLTLADADRIFQSTAYLDKVVGKLVEFVWDRDNYRGTGRLFLP